MYWWRLKRWKSLALAIATGLILILGNNFALSKQFLISLPVPQAHPLPRFLATWEASENTGDYFDQIESTEMGYLIWSNFPVEIYIEQPSKTENTASNRRFWQWVATVRKAIAEWNVYLPLAEIDNFQQADIVVLRSLPERTAKINPETGLYDISRAITAQTNFRFYLQEQTQILAHKMTVSISPNFLGESLLATIRHELGHALGIWGHSPEPTDALYYSQVANPAHISSRDITTLKKIYQQPTRLGWNIERSKTK
ncbi:peptidase [Myxosarcina sp. GI1]|uniref:peptidase n=1 Tax=Myxosarcina sp. GI1 TaxID=1541065 RepID=UPI00055C3A01|nr:peptidase [Myxosarcina sp. GI1]